MHQNQIGVIARRRLKRLAGALSQHMHGYTGLLGEVWQDVREQTRIFDRGGGSENYRLRRWRLGRKGRLVE